MFCLFRKISITFICFLQFCIYEVCILCWSQDMYCPPSLCSFITRASKSLTCNNEPLLSLWITLIAKYWFYGLTHHKLLSLLSSIRKWAKRRYYRSCLCIQNLLLLKDCQKSKYWYLCEMNSKFFPLNIILKLEYHFRFSVITVMEAD